MNRTFRSALLAAMALASSCASDKERERLVVQTVSESSGVPVAGVQVQVNDQAWATTGADGKASFDTVSGPYTLRVHQSLGNSAGTYQASKVWVLEGRSGNAVVPVDGSPGPWRRSGVAGTVTGRASSASTVTLVAGLLGGAAVAADGAFSGLPQWQGATSQSLTVRALEWDGAQPPAHYLGFGTATVPVSDGGNVAGVAVPLQPVAEGAVSGTVTVPSSLSSSTSLAWYTYFTLAFSDFEALTLLADTSAPPASPSWTLPRVAGASTWVDVVAAPPPGTAAPSPYPSSGHSRKVTVPSSGVAFDLPAPVELTAPADGATIDGATAFQWTAASGTGKYALRVSCSWTAGGVDHVVSYREVETTGTQASLPTIPGLSLASGASCTWSVRWRAALDPAVELRYSGSVERSATAR